MTGSPTPTPVAEPDLSGRTLGDYRLLRRLGRGAMAEVYLAEQQSLKRSVAVKVLRRSLASDPTFIQRFRLEAQSAAALVHANIVQIYDVNCVDGTHYIAQEYVQGQNLQQLVSRDGPLPLALAVNVMRQVAAALCKAAERGIVHRDIKPENIMLSRSGAVKVADFGLARVVGAEAAANLTQVGVTMGTPLYMSPEQVEGRALDCRGDIYSFGATAFHMLSGRPPFEGETALAIAVQQIRSEPPRLESLRPDLPPALSRIVHRMLAKRPDERYAHPRDLLRELRALPVETDDDTALDLLEGADGLSFDATHEARYAATQQLAAIMAHQRRTARQRWGLAALAGSLALALILGTVLARAQREPYLLNGANASRVPVERCETALAQYFLAATLNTEEGWLSVRQYFADRIYFVRRADQQLARIYLLEGDYERATALFAEFAGMDPTEQHFRAFGLAGLCVIDTLEGRYEESAAILNELLPLTAELDPVMSQMLEFVVQQNRRALSPQDLARWRELFERQAAEAAGTEATGNGAAGNGAAGNGAAGNGTAGGGATGNGTAGNGTAGNGTAGNGPGGPGAAAPETALP